jgi:hypothetical protein
MMMIEKNIYSGCRQAFTTWLRESFIELPLFFE